MTDLGRQLEELTQVVVQSTSTLPTNSSQPASKIELSELDNERIPKSNGTDLSPELKFGLKAKTR